MSRSGACKMVVLLAVLGLAGCHGAAGGPNGVVVAPTVAPEPPAPPPPTLTLTVTNAAAEEIFATASTSDETLDLGAIEPGQTVCIDMGEMPDFVTVGAVAFIASPVGTAPSFPFVAESKGVDYSEASPQAYVVFQDPAIGVGSGDFSSSDPGMVSDPGTSGTDTGSTGTDTGSTGTDTGSTGTDTGSTGTDTGSTGTDTGSSGSDSGSSGSDSGSSSSADSSS